MRYRDWAELQRRKNLFETYNPQRKVKMSKEQGASIFLRLGNVFLLTSGFIFFIASGILLSIKSFFSVKKKISDKNIFKRKYMEIRVKKEEYL